MKQVYTALFEAACKQAPVSCIIPVSEGMLQAYNRTGFTFDPLGRVRSAEITGTEACAADALPAERLSWQEYARFREIWLKPYPHAVYPDSYYSLSAEYENVFLSLPGALAAVIPLGNRCIVSELLCPYAEPARAVAGIAAACRAEQYEVRTPSFFPGPGEFRSFAYCHAAGETIPAAEEFWYPFDLE